ncbi:HAD-IA family hydrolase [Microbulbifer sp. THAF38]|uniref:HAD-IA family hydrolase n=1 Tax=Microbulbifer sp. THAF38 TaxID=2587856 RepID=UPI00126906D5|nr:HAD-IA family hydrolase [Microbulbifer sp. THAF38]QFT54684.1 6-phosphogluconate phosphatase [Microbulbifer sp. THAF38]
MDNCLLFDNDGTLVDSEYLCNIGLVLMFRRFGIALDADELVIRFRGWKLSSLLSILEKENGLDLPGDFVQEYRTIVSGLFNKELRPVEGVIEALEALDAPKAVVSSGPIEKIKHTLGLCGLSKYFGDNLYSSYEVGIWKPDPGIYLHAAKRMGYPVENCIVIDDGPVGVKAGTDAGMTTFFFNRFEEQCNIKGIVSFTTMDELPGLVGNTRD